MSLRIFKDRIEAGNELAKRLGSLSLGKAVVLALPRGGVLIGFQISQSLNIPLDTIIARKLWTGGSTEVRFGTIAQEGIILLDKAVITKLNLSPEDISDAISKGQSILEHEMEYFDTGSFVESVEFNTIILAVDGVASGATLRAVIEAMRIKYGSKRIICAAPVCSAESCVELSKYGVEMVCLLSPEYFLTVGQWYERFNPISDDEALYLLHSNAS